MYGPMGVGALMIRSAVRLHLRPLLLGGGMFAQHPAAPYEAGTLNVVGIVGLAEACRVLKKYYDPGLTVLLVQELLSRQLEVFVPPVEVRSGIVSFAVPGVHAHDIAQGLAENDIAVRAGYHCAEPVARQCRVDGTVRVSMSHATTCADIRNFLSALDAVIALWKTS
jgi:cysteine desulfurase/selenocysteine lyase